MKLKLIGSIALFLLCAGLALSQQPAPPEFAGVDPQQPVPQPRGPQQPQPARGGAGPQQPQPGRPDLGPPQQPPPPGHDPFAQNLFPPDFVMQHRKELNLSEEQKTSIRDESIKASTRFNELQFQMQDEMETMIDLTRAAAVDEQRAMAQLDKILNIEREVKRTQLLLTIRVKNKLTADQQARLHEMQRDPPQPR